MRPSRTATPSSVRPRLPRLDSSAHLGHIFFHLPQGGPEAGLRRERSELEGFSVRGFATPQMSGDQSSCDLTRPIESLQCLIRLAERSVGDSQIEPGRGVLVPFGYLRASSLNQVGEENAALVLPSRLHQSQSVKQHPSGPTSAAGDDVEHAGRKTPGFLNVLNGTLEVPGLEAKACRRRVAYHQFLKALQRPIVITILHHVETRLDLQCLPDRRAPVGLDYPEPSAPPGEAVPNPLTIPDRRAGGSPA